MQSKTEEIEIVRFERPPEPTWVDSKGDERCTFCNRIAPRHGPRCKLRTKGSE